MQLPKNVEVGNRITAQEAATRHGLNGPTLWQAIDAGTVRALVVEVGSRRIRLVDPEELEQDLARLPRCAYDGCEGLVLKPGSKACSGPHARALETKGKHWRTREAIEKSNAAKRGKPRPDVRERVAAMHADPKQRYAWGVALAEGRRLPANSKRRWKGRLGGLTAAHERGAGPPRKVLRAETIDEVRRLTAQGFGRDYIARKLDISPRQVRNAREA